jgi:hypothetical protein
MEGRKEGGREGRKRKEGKEGVRKERKEGTAGPDKAIPSPSFWLCPGQSPKRSVGPPKLPALPPPSFITRASEHYNTEPGSSHSGVHSVLTKAFYLPTSTGFPLMVMTGSFLRNNSMLF